MAGEQHHDETPWDSQKKAVVATRKEAISPEQMAKMPKGPPPRQGRLPGEGVPRGAGTLPDQGVPPDEGVMPGEGKLPGEEGQRAKGDAGQVDRGAPGQMDPWAENPWAPGGSLEDDDDWAPPPLPDAEGDGEDGVDDFYLQHPNLHGADDEGT